MQYLVALAVAWAVIWLFLPWIEKLNKKNGPPASPSQNIA
jgi:hypothetical protein